MTANVTNLPAVQPAAVAIRQPNQTVRSSSILANPEQAKINMRAAELFASSDLVPNHYRNKPANCFIAINRAQRLGIDEMYFLEKTFIISGKLGMAAELAIELANSSGRFKGQIKFRLFGEGEARGCTAFATLACDGDVVENTVTYAMALAEGWTKNAKWTSLRDQMLQYRAGVFLARLYAGGSLGGMYTRDELEDVDAIKKAPKDEQPGQTVTVIAPPADEPEAPITEDYITEYETGLRSMLKRVKTLDALDDLWRTEKVEINAIGGTDNEARLRLISAFSQKKADILDRLEADAEVGETHEPAPGNNAAPEAEARTQQAPSAPEDTITTATRAMQADQPASPKADLPPPTAINVPNGEDGQPNWKAFSAAAAKALEHATDNDCGDEWLIEWRKANNAKLNELRAVSKKAADFINDMYTQRLDHFIRLREEAKAEAEKFTVIPMPYDGENPNWPKFADALKAYIADTTSHRAAAIWWGKHAMQLKNMREADPQTAEAVEQALHRKFPQLAK
jgi:hypothetical protein